MSPVVVNILDLIDMGGSEVIEHKLATFSSPKNPEIEDFIQRQIGGGIVYLDCEDKEELTSFYKRQNFKQFDDRYSTEDNQKYIQFMRFF